MSKKGLRLPVSIKKSFMVGFVHPGQNSSRSLQCDRAIIFWNRLFQENKLFGVITSCVIFPATSVVGILISGGYRSYSFFAYDKVLRQFYKPNYGWRMILQIMYVSQNFRKNSGISSYIYIFFFFGTPSRSVGSLTRLKTCRTRVSTWRNVSNLPFDSAAPL